MVGKRSEAVQAAHERLRHRVEGQLRIVQAFFRAEQQLAAAQEQRAAVNAENQARLEAVHAENRAKTSNADEAIRTRKAERAEALAGLAVVVNNDDETATLVNVSPAEVRSARRAVPAERARKVAARSGKRNPAAPSTSGAQKPPTAPTPN